MQNHDDSLATETIEAHPGWTTIVELAQYLAGPAHSDPQQRRPVAAGTRNGRLLLEAADAPADTRGALAAAMAVASETCERCGGKGDPVAGTGGLRAGSRCAGCRTPAQTVLPREWNARNPVDRPDAVSPGQWTADIRGGATGNEWDHTGWRCYRRLETAYRPQIAELMRADNDNETMRLWAGGPGWAGLLRALFLTLQPEQDERPEDPGHVPWRLRWMKEKFGTLDVRTSGQTPYQNGAVRFVETMSNWVCIRCGKPAEMRNTHWIRPECGACWSRAPGRDHDEERRRTAESTDEPEGTLGFRGLIVTW